MKDDNKQIPWLYQLSGGDHDYLIYSEKTGATVAISHGDDEAKASLIAAAPELLEALEECLPHIGVGYSAIQRYYIIDKCRKAISKAKGLES